MPDIVGIAARGEAFCLCQLDRVREASGECTWGVCVTPERDGLSTGLPPPTNDQRERLQLFVHFQSTIAAGECTEDMAELVLVASWVERPRTHELIPVAGRVVDVREHREALARRDETFRFEQVLPDDVVRALLLEKLRDPLFFRDSVRSHRVEKQEVALGYTTALTTANSRPDLYLLDRTSRRVLARPGEPRPLNIRKKETDKALARQATGHRGEL